MSASRGLGTGIGVFSLCFGMGCSAAIDPVAPPSTNSASAGTGWSSGGSGAGSGGASTSAAGASGAAAGIAGSGGAAAGASTGGAAGSAGTSSGGTPGIIPAQGCESSQEPGTWANVTPAAMKMSGDYINGPIAALVNPANTSDIYVQNQYDGTWKSTNCGVTWEKVNTGTNGASIDNGRQWYAAIDPNPARDPSTAPTLYTTLGYGSGGIWKSTNGGVDWSNIWQDNVYGSDGTTNIFSDVGGDVSGVAIASSNGPDHLIAFLHGYWGSGDNNGVFESTDGGGSWRVHVSSYFAFQAHGDVVFPVDDSTWVVGHGEMFRTTDAGENWSSAGDAGTASVGRAWWIVGDTVYAGSDFWGGIFRSSDRGASWKKVGGNKVSWVVATETNLYASADRESPHILRAALGDDENWEDTGNPSGMTSGGSRAAVTFDGEHYIIIAAQESGGLWRYVEE